MFFSVLLLIGLAVVLNVNLSSATTVNQTDIINSTHTNNNSTVSHTVTSTTSNKTVKTNSVSNSTKNMAAGGSTTVNGLSVSQLNDGISRVQTFYFKNNRLPNYVNFGTRKIQISTFQKNIATAGLSINLSVNGLTVAQMKDGISRVQTFYSNNGRLPNYVNFGTKKILITTFQSNIATAGLKLSLSSGPKTIDTSSVSALAKSLAYGSSSQYETAQKIFNWVRDNVSYSFYYDTVNGASGTLAKRLGNCCDKTHLLIALSRAVGITAQYKWGSCYFIVSKQWYGHVWANLYLDGKWVAADTTSCKNSLGVINNWNTATFTLKGTYTTLPF